MSYSETGGRDGGQTLVPDEAASIEALRAKIRTALDDPAPSLPAEQVFAELRAFHDEQMKAVKRGEVISQDGADTSPSSS